MGVSFVGTCGGLITAIQHGVWVAKSGVRVCKSCKKTESDEQGRTAQLLMDLMGDSQSMPMNNRRAPPPEIRYTSRSENREDQGRAGSGFEPSLIAEKIREACSGKMIG